MFSPQRVVDGQRVTGLTFKCNHDACFTKVITRNHKPLIMRMSDVFAGLNAAGCYQTRIIFCGFGASG